VNKVTVKTSKETGWLATSILRSAIANAQCLDGRQNHEIAAELTRDVQRTACSPRKSALAETLKQ